MAALELRKMAETLDAVTIQFAEADTDHRDREDEINAGRGIGPQALMTPSL